MTVTVYTFEDEDGSEQVWTTQNPVEARDYARLNQLKMIANEYEYSDSEVVEDFTPKRKRQQR